MIPDGRGAKLPLGLLALMCVDKREEGGGGREGGGVMEEETGRK